MKRIAPAMAVAVGCAFAAGLLAQVLYQRWNPAAPQFDNAHSDRGAAAPEDLGLEPKNHRVTYAPLEAPVQVPVDIPLLTARDVEKIRRLAGSPARVRGRIFRVGHSAKSNTYFLNFGPSREALTAVIFAAAAELFEKNKMAPKSLEGKQVELQGEVKDHPQYGLEIILESPAQIKVLD